MIRILRGRLRAGAYCVGACLTLIASHSWGLGLGEIKLDSALNEKLSAQIELIDASSLQPTEILVSLASLEDFERIGVERFYLLTDLHFEVDFGTRGIPVVMVSTSLPITEPYLNFLVEVLWPNGRLLKEYTLLLDPPTFSQAAAPAVTAPGRGGGPSPPAGRVDRPGATGGGTQVQLSPTAQRPAARPRLDGELTTDRWDTLWAIASRNRPTEQISVQQTMIAIQRLNPDAFINNNINLLKAGYVLRMPSESQTRSVRSDAALATVAAQNDEWRAFGRGEAPSALSSRNLAGQVDATSDRAAAPTERTPPEGELRIETGSADSASELNAAREEQDRLGLAVDELTYQLDREQEAAKNQLELKDRQLEVRDQQIADLQAQLAAMQQRSEGQQNQNQNTSAAAPGEPWWQSPYVLGGAAGVLVLALVAGLIAARRNRETGDEFYHEEPAVADERSDSDVVPVAEALLDETLNEFEDEEEPIYAEDPVDDERATALPGEDELDDEEPQRSETGDVIGEADIYIAYGRFPQAISLLSGVLEDDPDRNDVRLKMLELFVETNDQEAFDTQMLEFVDRCDDTDALLTARELEARLGENALDLEQSAASGDGSTAEETAETVETQPDDLAGADDFDLDLQADPSDSANAEESPASDSFENLDGEDLAAGALEPSTEEPLFDLEDLSTELDEPSAALEEPQSELEDPPSADLEEPAAYEPIDTGSEEDFELELDDAADTAEASNDDLGIDFNPDGELETAADEVTPESVNLEEETSAVGVETSVAGAETLAVEPLDDIEFESEVATVEDDEFEFEDDGDSANTKLDLARAYIDMGDEDGARDILREVLDEGNGDQQQQAQSMLEGL